MPRKVFVAGEILTAADVNANLMDQSVMVFDNAGARGSAITSPTEGMVTYLKDSDQLFKYTTDWVPAGGLVEVKQVLKTDTFSASVAAGANVAVTDLSITHAVANASNRLIITAVFGVAGNSFDRGNVGLALHDGTGLIGVGGAAGVRSQVSSGMFIGVSNSNNSSSLSTSFVHTPGAGSKTYTVRAVNLRTDTQTVFVNRNSDDADNQTNPRGVSSLIIQEVAV
jgi:hypothetical protein